MQQHLTAQLPPTFYSGPFAKQSANAVCTELVQLPQQQLQLLPQQPPQPPQLQLVNKSVQPSTKSTITIWPFKIICTFSKFTFSKERNTSCKTVLWFNFFIFNDLRQTATNLLSWNEHCSELVYWTQLYLPLFAIFKLAVLDYKLDNSHYLCYIHLKDWLLDTLTAHSHLHPVLDWPEA